MTGTIRIRGQDPPPQQHTGWMTHAACTPDPIWTTDHKPPQPLLNALRDICAHCPVQTECAQHALTENARGGVYAGIWIPVSARGVGYLQARALLHHKTRAIA